MELLQICIFFQFAFISSFEMVISQVTVLEPSSNTTLAALNCLQRIVRANGQRGPDNTHSVSTCIFRSIRKGHTDTNYSGNVL